MSFVNTITMIESKDGVYLDPKDIPLIVKGTLINVVESDHPSSHLIPCVGVRTGDGCYEVPIFKKGSIFYITARIMSNSGYYGLARQAIVENVTICGKDSAMPCDIM